MKIEQAPKIVFTNNSFERMMEYARAATGEIAGFGTVEEHDGIYVVTESYIMPQQASGGGVLINADTVQEFMEWCNANGHPERPAKARLWWHSHANFSVFRSVTDKGTVALLRQVMPYLICMVVNKNRDYELSFYQGDIVLSGIKAVKTNPLKQLRSEIESEVEAMVKPMRWGMNEHDDDTDTKHVTYTPTEIPEVGKSEFDDPEIKLGEALFRSGKSYLEMTNDEFAAYEKYCSTATKELDGEMKGEAATERVIVEEGQPRPDPEYLGD